MKKKIAGMVGLTVAGMIMASSALAAHTGTATFTGAGGIPLSYSEAGIDFTSLFPGGHVHLDGSTIENHDGGCCTTPISITHTGGGLFNLDSLDIIFDSGLTTFVGSNAAIYTVTGTGFVSFGSLFAGVSSVVWNSSDAGSFGDSFIDNVTISPVPEPETYAMMLVGLGLLGFSIRRTKQKEDAVA